MSIPELNVKKFSNFYSVVGKSMILLHKMKTMKILLLISDRFEFFIFNQLLAYMYM